MSIIEKVSNIYSWDELGRPEVPFTRRAFYYPTVPQNLLVEGMEKAFQSETWHEIQEIIQYYNIVENGADFRSGSFGDFEGSDLHYKIIRRLLYKEARFMASKPLEFVFEVQPESESKPAKDGAMQAQDAYTNILSVILKENRFDGKFTKAVKDCLIGKRVALVANFNTDGVQVDFLPSLEFTAEYDKTNRKLVRFVAFYSTVESVNANDRRIYRKVYKMGDDGFCHVSEGLYDGSGNLVETISEEFKTELQFIPAVIILNDGLTGDTKGESEVKVLADSESWFSKMANTDIDAERKSMNPTRVIVDADPASTADLSAAPGSLWDLVSAGDAEHAAQVVMLESGMTYSGALSETLKRMENDMYDQVGVPNINLETMKGNITSGKGLRAIYWDLIIRVEEKMLSWKPELEQFVAMLFEGCRAYPEFLAVTVPNIPLPDAPYNLIIENRYPIPEDEAEEKQLDLLEVNAKVMSKKAYMMKWRGLSDDEVTEELQQIALERQLLEDSFFTTESYTQPVDNSGDNL